MKHFADPVVATAILDRLLHHFDSDHHPRRQLPASRKASFRPIAEGRNDARDQGNRKQ
ncbi:hypothetical protein [Mesorhizobium sp.]|uniref:hypothetical protein n=1 Tax=Mesorhizobium sp. TaxID=1871066 RepID=UPI00257A8699|nr:hypothetical protein [Mesorhizobium sp.]